MPRGQRGLSLERLREMARTGAETTLNQLRAEIVAIERTFPELVVGRPTPSPLTQDRRETNQDDDCRCAEGGQQENEEILH